ncbi:MAG: ABC transporter ATP-binding protein/permease [Oscillospiraceae bacterium]|jgi:ATP-binding cassette subfamily B protein|nr:ABC transporter ATP-binding protein/permease [Oscillospiraceae bacterium]
MDEKELKGLAKLRYIFFLLKPFWKYGKTYVIVTVLMSALLQPLATYLTTLLPKAAIDGVVAGVQRQEILMTIGFYTIGIAVIALAQKVVELTYTQLAQTKISNKIKNDVNEKALFTDFKYYDNPEFFTKFVFAQQQYPMQSHLTMQMFPQVLQGIVTMVAMGSIIVSAGPMLLCVTVFFVILNALLGIPTLKPEADFQVKYTEVWRPFYYVTQILMQKENAAELRSSGAGQKMLRVFNTVTKNFYDISIRFIKKTIPFRLAQGLISPIQLSCVLAYIIIFVINGDVSKIGLYASLTAASSALVSSLDSVYSTINNMLRNALYGERVAAFFEAKSEIEPIALGKLPPPKGSYEIELHDVSFHYENAAFAIEHLNLHIQAGQRVAIVGENGAGKSTLTKLLLRLYDTTAGEVLINGKNIKEYDVHALRLHIGVAFQDVRILAMSLRDNLTVYHDLPDDQLMKVIEKLGLGAVVEKADGDISKMISREFTEDGIVLSGGEAQRVTLARLFTGSFGLLVLDEPSSALDPLAEHKLMQNILDASNSATTIMIAHRLSTVRDFDTIYHVENGKIIESGTHDELMASHSKYYEMFMRQGQNYQVSEVNE